jgi:serine/threonine protein kinase
MSHKSEPVYHPGQIFAGKYRVERTLGVGGFGVVLAAIHTQLEERVAIKVLLPEAATHPTAPARFIREARMAAKIRSEHVARVTDVGQLEDGTPYMVMEYLSGEDLSMLVKRARGQSVPDVCEWILQACEALAEAHGLGMVHRDLKPANLFLTRRIDGSPCIKVLDFGISKLQGEAGAAEKGMTRTSEVMGSPFYMSPEQMKSTRDVDVRADVWALGTILFELLTGHPPFDAETMTGLIVAIMQDPPRDLAQMRPDVPRELVQAITTCLHKDPNARFQDVVQLSTALAPYAPPRAATSLPRITAAIGAARSSRGPSIPPGAISAGSPFAGSAPHPSGPHATVPGSPAVLPLSVSGSGASPAVTGGAVSSEWAKSVASKPAPSRALLFVGIAAAAVILLGGSALAFRHLRTPPGEASAPLASPAISGPPAVPQVPVAPSGPAMPASSPVAGDDAPPSTSASIEKPAGKAPPVGPRPAGPRPPAKTSEPAPPPPPPARPNDPFAKPI